MPTERMSFLSCLLISLASHSAAHAAEACTWVAPTEYAAIVGGKLDGKPGGNEDTCTATFDRYQRTAQVQVVEGFGESSRYPGLVKFWQEENARARKRGEAVEEKTVGDVFCFSKVPNFTSPTTECMQELPGKRVLYARVTAQQGSGRAPPTDVALKLLATALPKAK